MSLKIVFSVLDQNGGVYQSGEFGDGDLVNFNVNRQLDVCELYADVIDDGNPPNIIYGSEEYNWTFTILQGTNVEQSNIVPLTGHGPHQLIFYDEGLNTIHLKMTRERPTGSGQTIDEFFVSIDVFVYEMDSRIHGADYVLLGSEDVTYFVKPGAESYLWSTNETTDQITLDFNRIKDVNLSCQITHGQQQQNLSLFINVTTGSIVVGGRVDFNVEPNLLFFNSHGDNLNFEYVEYEDGEFRWEGDLIFAPNSNETFRTIVLYTMENVAPIMLSNDDVPEAGTNTNTDLMLNSLNLIRYQLFNEFGTDFIRARETELEVTNVEKAINVDGFYSKWVYGTNFHLKYRTGSEVWFENIKFTNGTPPDFESNEGAFWRTYTVIDGKLDAILILTDTENTLWNYTYDIENPGKIYSANFTRVWNPDFIDPQWNEAGFRAADLTGIYDKKKLTFLNTQKNDGVFTVNFPEDNLDLPYNNKYFLIDCLNREDLPPGFGFEVELKFLTTRVFVSNSPIDIIPAATTDVFLNRKNLMFFDWTRTRDRTPTILQNGSEFTFEPDGINPNFSYIYTITQKNAAINILVANDSDRKGWTIAVENVIDSLTDPPTIQITNFDTKVSESTIFNVDLTQNDVFSAQMTLLETTGNSTLSKEDLANLIQIELGNQAQGIQTFWEPGLESVIVNESQGWLIQSTTIKSSQDRLGLTSTMNNPTNGKLPTNGILGTRMVTLNENTIGYIYRRTRTNTFHIQVDYDFANQLPIWYTVDELQTTLWVQVRDTLTYMQNAQQPLYLTDTTIKFEQEWTNQELLTAIRNVDLNLVPPDAQIFTDIAVEQLTMFQSFITNWRDTFDFYGVELYVQTSTNKWDFDIIYDIGDYVSFNGLFYQSLENNNKENQPDVSAEWLVLDSLVLLCGARKYTINATDNQKPDVKSDYIQITYNGINYDENASTSGSLLVPLEQTQEVFEGYQFQVLEELTDEFNHIFGTYNRPQTVGVRAKREVIINDIDEVFGLNIKINGIEYPVRYDNIPTSQPPDIDRSLDIQETLFDWGNALFMVEQDLISPNDDSDIGLKYYQQLESLGIIVWLERSGEKDPIGGTNGLAPYDTVVFQGKYPNVNFTFELFGTNNRHKIRHSAIEFFTIGQVLTITINNFPLSASGTTSTDAVTNWVNLYSIRLLEEDIIVQENTSYNGYPEIEFFTLYDKTKLSYTVWVGINPLPVHPLYNVIDYRPGNEGIIIAGNEVLNLIPGSDFQKALFATGMIVSIAGSKWPLNDQEYNILLVDPINLGLSYQGPFWNSSDQFGESFDDSDVDPDEPGRQSFDWEAVADPVVKFDIFDFLKLERVNDVGVEIPTYQVIYEETTNFNLADIISWKWNFGDGNSQLVVNPYVGTGTPPVDSGTNGTNGNGLIPIEEIRLATNVYESDGAFTVSLTMAFVTGDFRTSSTVYVIEDDIIYARGPQTIDDIALKTRQFLRYPREGYDQDPQITMTWTWDDSGNNTDVFLYDFIGTQLGDEGVLTYTGPKPLIADGDAVFLNEEANKQLEYVDDPSFQQTVFTEINYPLEKIDSETDITFEPEPMQTFIAFNSVEEGVDQRTLILLKEEPITISIVTDRIESNRNDDVLPISEYNNVVFFISELKQIKIERFDKNFVDLGVRIGQKLRVNGFDNTQENGQSTFLNSGKVVKVKNFGINWIQLTDDADIVDEISYKIVQESIAPYNTISISMTVELIVEPLEVARFNILGQTEIEDDRYRVMMYNNGIGVNPNDTYIFSEYDINEAGIDWTFLNKKRKEMLANFPEIYNYIGAYKAVINAINYFGYNELEFNEYYRDVDENSPRYGKLEKLLIPDLFNNLVEGYTVSDFVLGLMPTKRYWKTNLFNLTYKITDFEGNNVLGFSLDEVVVKLIGLKNWLNQETIPIGRRILDITGDTSNHHPFAYAHDMKQVTNIKIHQDLSPVDFRVEAYLQPVVNYSETFNVHIEFFTVDDTIPDYFQLNILTFSTEEDILKDDFELRAVQIIREIRTTMDAYNFAADSNVDPFILIETITDNGYGLIYKNKRTYSLQAFAFLN